MLPSAIWDTGCHAVRTAPSAARGLRLLRSHGQEHAGACNDGSSTFVGATRAGYAIIESLPGRRALAHLTRVGSQVASIGKAMMSASAVKFATRNGMVPAKMVRVLNSGIMVLTMNTFMPIGG